MNPVTIYIVVVLFFIYRLITRKKGLKSADAKEIMSNGAKIIDVRSPLEYKSGHYKGAINIPHTDITTGIRKAKIKKEHPIILYCASGSRASIALRELKAKGYTNIHNAGSQRRLRTMLT